MFEKLVKFLFAIHLKNLFLFAIKVPWVPDSILGESGTQGTIKEDQITFDNDNNSASRCERL